MLPQDIDDPTLGRLKRTRLVEGCRDEYVGTLDTGGGPVELTLSSDDKRDMTRTLERAREVVTRFPAILDAVRPFAALHYVREYNDTWRVDDEDLTPEAFLDAFRLTDVMIHAAGNHTLWCEAGDLFEGHFIEIRMSPAGEFVSTDLLG